MNRLPEFLRRRLPAASRLEWYPPLRALRVRVVELSPDWRRVRIRLPLRENRNPGGSMFGGAMACVADPVAALSCARLFPGQAVWTRELALDFHREARTDMELRYAIEADHEQAIRDELARRGRATPTFAYGFFDLAGRECVSVRCRVAIRPAGYRPREGVVARIDDGKPLI
jgi:acyl-coenzyme A thioesterase PaaI-like protein